MKAFVLNNPGSVPGIQDFQEPQISEAGQVIVTMLAAGMNPVDSKMMALMPNPLPRVVGLEGVGTLEDGRRVYVGQSVPPFGTFAERAVAVAEQNIILPEGLADGPAVALGVTGMAAWLPLSWKAKLRAGESVLVLGATGVQGQLAVQAAKLLGAGYVVAAGRNHNVLESLKSRGADAVAVLQGDLAQAIKSVAPERGYDVVIDGLFGEPLSAMLSSGTLGPQSRVVILGSSAGHEITLSYRQLMSTNGASIASYSSFNVPMADKRDAYLVMAQHVLAGELSVDVQAYPLDRAVEAWEAQDHGPHQKIIVVPS